VPASVPERHATDPLVCGLTELARSTLLFLDDRPGTSSAEIGVAVGVTHASQMSRHLRRLEGEGLVVGARDGRRNAWALTVLGTETVTQLRG
jgi:DNA-binding MarR family transcriptional regulator